MTGNSEPDLKELWKKYKDDKDIDARNHIITYYSYLIKKVVNRLGLNYCPGIDTDDLIGYGVFGLIDAVERFDPSKSVKFETYAVFRIHGAIIDQVRKQDWIPRSMRDKAKRIWDAIEKVESTLGRSATDQELAEYLGMKPSVLQKTLGELHSLSVLSLDDQIIDTVHFESQTNDQVGSPHYEVEIKELKDTLARMIDELEEKERTIISLYYYEELTLKEIGMVLGVSESRVSQLHSRALMKLRGKLARY
jgi:RNA polymerase sigma factor for flagellar operon FliA